MSDADRRESAALMRVNHAGEIAAQALYHGQALAARSKSTRKMLLENVWEIHFDPHTSVVESHVSRLRTKLNHGFAIDAIQTVRSVGYRLLASN